MRTFALILSLMLGASCHSKAAFESCYRQCMNPPPGGCEVGHEWCVLACRDGHDAYTRVPAHFATTPETQPTAPTALAQTLAIEILGGEASPLVKRCAELPVDYQETFSTAVDNQAQVDVVLVTGESKKAAENQLLGRVILDGISPAPRTVPQIELTVHVDKAGAISARAKDLKTGRTQNVSMKR